MKKLLNTLYVTSENSYLSLDGENVVILEGDRELGRLPLHNLEGSISVQGEIRLSYGNSRIFCVILSRRTSSTPSSSALKMSEFL